MIKSFMEFMQLKNEEDNQSMGTKQTANDLIKDLLHFKLGDKLLYNNKPIQIENIIVDATDSNKKRIHQTLHSVKEAADFIDNKIEKDDTNIIPLREMLDIIFEYININNYNHNDHKNDKTINILKKTNYNSADSNKGFNTRFVSDVRMMFDKNEYSYKISKKRGQNSGFLAKIKN